ncbi:TRAP transporter large permease (plasmid) [Leisingera sp. M527]|uniref:TRAP transporter large permease n=1 Tax=Leisingera sp. M527 TaxID=2867014 RepID=UPI0021A29BB8|nr:TRAP transporter large permease [Leisingera sp. M527]UWQ35422.1 TRAP transporter large permease [Leisingera sp. M527]
MDIAVIALIVLLATLVIGVPVPFAFGAATITLSYFGGYSPDTLIPVGYSKMNTVVLLAIPLFILSGGLMEKGRIADPLVNIAETIFGRLSGGLGVAGVLASAVFGAISGSGAATLSCIGTVLFPKLEERGYPKGHSTALLACASPLGLLIPPSALMILYAWVAQLSVLKCFLATVVPGLIVMLLLSITNLVMLRKNDNIRRNPHMPPVEVIRTTAFQTTKATPALLMPVLILGGIYGGLMTPTEAAGVAALYAIPVGFFIYRGLTLKRFADTLVETAVTTGVVMVMLFVVMILSRLFIFEELPEVILDYLRLLSENPLVIMLMLNVFMLIVGMLMDDVSGVLLCTPILLPIVTEIGVDPIHFAAILGVNLGMGNITPPTAPLLYLSSRLSKSSINETLRPTLILIAGAWLPALLLTTYVPEIAMWLPELLLD